MTGTTLAASSEVTPMISARFGVVANICLVAGTASAGSPLVSTPLQLSLWPSAPSGPLNGARSATTMAECEPLALVVPLLEVELELQAARAAVARTAAAADRTAAVRRLVLCDRRVMFVPSAVRVLPTAVRARGTGEPRLQAARRGARLPSPAGAVTRFGDHAVADGSDALDGDLDDIPGLEPDRGLAGEADPARRPGGDDVAGPQCGERGEELHRAGYVHQHLARPRVLHDLAVEHGGEGHVGHVGLVRRHHLRADGHAGVEVLPWRPLGAGPLPVPR